MPQPKLKRDHNSLSDIVHGQASHSDSDIGEALHSTRGLVSLAAQQLGAKRTTLEDRIKNNPELLQIVKDEREVLVDHAELQLWNAVISGEKWAIMFVLDRLGVNRGFGLQPYTPTAHVIHTVEVIKTVEAPSLPEPFVDGEFSEIKDS